MRAQGLGMLVVLLAGSPAAAAPILSNFEGGGSVVATSLHQDVVFWSTEAFVVQAFRDAVVRPGIALDNEFSPFQMLRVGKLFVATAPRAALPSCGTVQVDAHRGEWTDLTYGYWQFAGNCAGEEPPYVPPVIPPPPTVPEPPVGTLALLALALWRILR
jgi:hypothetical protein